MITITVTAHSGYAWTEDVDDDADLATIIDDIVDEHGDIFTVTTDPDFGIFYKDK